MPELGKGTGERERGQKLLQVLLHVQRPEQEGVHRTWELVPLGGTANQLWQCFTVSSAGRRHHHFSHSPLEGCGVDYTHKSLHSKGNTRGLRSRPLEDGPCVTLRVRVKISSMLLSLAWKWPGHSRLVLLYRDLKAAIARYRVGKRSTQNEWEETSLLSWYSFLVDGVGSEEWRACSPCE